MTSTVVKWAPFPEFDVMERRMRRLLENVGVAPVMVPVPAADVYETPTELVVELEVPGYEEKKLAVELSNHLLTIKGEHLEKKAEAEKAFRVQERLESRFERSFQLPLETDTKHVTARFGKGLLEVRAAKLQTTTPQKVEITKT